LSDKLAEAAALIARQEAEAARVSVKCIRCTAVAVAVPRTVCECGGTFIEQEPVAQPQPGALNIGVEVYLLDALIAHADAIVKQLVFRGRMDLAQQLIANLQPLAVFRGQVDAQTRQGVVLAEPGAANKLKLV